jgi:hypothetical protein
MANTAVFGLYATRTDVEEAIEQLRSDGFRSTDISVLLPENDGSKDLGHEKATKAPEGLASGATSGAVLGGTLGWLVGIGALVIPGLGPFVAAGPLMALLSGVGVGATVGGLTGALVGLGIPEYEAKRYEGRVKRGSILLSVHCDSREWADIARRTLARTGAEDIAAASEARGDFANSDRPYPRVKSDRVERDARVSTERVEREARQAADRLEREVRAADDRVERPLYPRDDPRTEI